MAKRTEKGTTQTEARPLMVFGCVLDGAGGCRAIGWDAVQDWHPASEKEVLWLHLDRTADGAAEWMHKALPASEATIEVLLSNETRPRVFREGEGLVCVLRGVNFNPGDEPEDMIAMQVWADRSRVVTLRRRRLQTPRDVLAHLEERGDGPKTAGDLVMALSKELIGKINLAITGMNERIDELEADAADTKTDEMLDEIGGIRRTCLAFKRYISPQFDALMELKQDPPDWMSPENRLTTREMLDRLHRYLEDLDVYKESALVLQDDLNNRAAAEMNRTMFVFSIIAAIFLPLGFVTGLLGINVGGMPGVNSSGAFWITVVVLAIIVGIEFMLFKLMKWL
ncbi:MAG: zinc transporter ZntB [Hyphomonas oceanitis]|uniref:zinc transporter ZntB n=1 Tax=Hyphomonas oceanitis TaxID=81033 RepID=UPI0030033BD5